MDPKLLWTFRWQQPYVGHNQYVRGIYNEWELLVEKQLESNEFPEAKAEIDRIMKL
jgi:hypothetical protein